MFNAVLRVPELVFRKCGPMALQFLETPCTGVLLKLLNQTGQAGSIDLNSGRPVDIVLTSKSEVSRKVTTKRGPSANPVVDLAPPRFRCVQFAVQRGGKARMCVPYKPRGFPVGAIRLLETGEIKGDPVSCLVEPAQQVRMRFVARSHMAIVE